MVGKYQNHYEDYIKDQSRVRDLMVRFRNQIDYDVFNTIGNQTIILGEDNMLFSKGYIDAVIRPTIKSEAWVKEKVRRLRTIIDYFEQKNTAFLVISPPSKARVYPDKLPSNLRNLKQQTTNRSFFKAAFEQYDIPFIDFDFLIDYESTHQLPTYPQAGLHWNYLAAALATDTMRHFLVAHYDLVMPTFIWPDTIPFHTDFKSTDTELLRSANLYSAVDLNPMPYPEINYSNIPDSLCPKAIVIGDSYYQILNEEGYHEALFRKGSPYWHYFGAEGFTRKDKLKRFNKNNHEVVEKIKAADVVIIASSETNLSRFSFGFIDFVYEKIQAKTENK